VIDSTLTSGNKGFITEAFLEYEKSLTGTQFESHLFFFWEIRSVTIKVTVLTLPIAKFFDCLEGI
jgi:hypothetical protein